MEQAQSKYMNYQQTAAYLNLSETTLRRYVMEKLIPHHKVGGRVLFCTQDIDEWMDQRKVVADRIPSPRGV